MAHADGNSILPGLFELELSGGRYQYVMYGTYCHVGSCPDPEVDDIRRVLPAVELIGHDSRHRTMTLVATNKITVQQWTNAWSSIVWNTACFPYLEAAELYPLRSANYDPEMFRVRDKYPSMTLDNSMAQARARYGNKPFDRAKWIEYRGDGSPDLPPPLQIKYRSVPRGKVEVGTLKFNLARKYSLSWHQLTMKLFDSSGQYVWEEYSYLLMFFRVATWDLDGDGTEEIIICSGREPTGRAEMDCVVVVLGQPRSR